MMENILLSNLEFERDIVIYNSDDLNIKTENQQALPIQVLEATSSTTYRYECNQCDYKTNKKSNHDSHIKFVHFKERDTCPECGKEIANLNQHLRVTHKIFKASSREKVCELCNKKFHNLEAHMLKTHNVKSPSEYVCNICMKTFAKKDHLARHETVVHLGLRQTCPFCNNQFSNLDKHIKTKHGAHLPLKETKCLYPCDLCNKVFNKKSILNTHQQTVHAVPVTSKKDTCPFCDKDYSNLHQHIEIVHNNTKKYSCQKCQKGFYDNRELRRHHIKYLKTGECQKEVGGPQVFKYSCDFENCSYKSNKKSNMEMHKQSVHLNIKFSCPECGKQLSSKANLNSHVKNVHDKKLVNGVLEKKPYHLSFRCKLCDYTTSRALHLDRHMLSVHSAAAFQTVQQVYQASTGKKEGETLAKPSLSSPIKSHHPRSLPQFANLVRLEKNSCEVDSEMILSDLTEDPKKTEEMIEAVVDNSELELGEYKDVQFVTALGDGVQVITRRVSTDNLSTSSHPLVINHELAGTEDDQIITQTSTLQVDSSGRLIIPEEATIVNLSGLVLPLDNNSISPIYFASY